MAHALEDLARIALAEDAPDGDITSRATIPEATSCQAELVIKQDGVLAGLEAAIAVFGVAAAEDGTTVEIDRKAGDGDRVRTGDRAALVFTYATTVAPGCSAFHARSWSASIEAASEQPASRLGSRTVLSGERIFAVSAMKWTPQKTIVDAPVSAAIRDSASESPTWCATSWIHGT